MPSQKTAPPKNIAQKVWAFAEPEVQRLGLRLWDVALEKAGSCVELILYIDCDGRPVSVEDCERVSHAVDPLLDHHNLIDASYSFSVSSTGHPRLLRRPEHFARCAGMPVQVHLYQSVGGKKIVEGTLRGYEDGKITLDCAGKPLRFAAVEVAQVKTVPAQPAAAGGGRNGGAAPT